MRQRVETGILVCLLSVLIAAVAVCSRGSVDAGAVLTNSGGDQQKPPPRITFLSPSMAVAGGPPFVLLVGGTGLANSSTVYWSGETRPTGYFCGGLSCLGTETNVGMIVWASDLFTPGIVSVTVFTPGLGMSNVLEFKIIPPPSRPHCYVCHSFAAPVAADHSPDLTLKRFAVLRLQK